MSHSERKKAAVLEKWMFASVELWLVVLFAIVFACLTVWFGSVVLRASSAGSSKSPLEHIALKVAEVPNNLSTLLKTGIEFSDGRLPVQRSTQILDGEYAINLNIDDESFVDDGYLLVSAYSGEAGANIVYIFDLGTRTILHQWTPLPEAVVAASSELSDQQLNGTLSKYETRRAYRAQAPLLLDGGSLVVTSGEGSLAQFNPCSQVEWVNPRHWHHSIERFGDGLIVPIISLGSDDDPKLRPFRNDGYAILTAHGKIIAEESILDIMYDNDLEHIVLGRNITRDSIHLNDAEVIDVTDDFVQAGDIMLSSRHLSAVFLYRPSTNKIVWYKSGPWMAQHDIDYLGKGIFSIFGNDNAIMSNFFPREHSTIYHFNMSSGEVTKPYDAVFSEQGIAAGAQGSHRILNNGDAFVENSNKGELWRMSEQEVRWKYVHRTAGGIGALHWSRYFQRDELNLDWIKDLSCPTS